MKQISIFLVGLAAAFASVPAWAEDFSAGKTPAQLFRSDCGECHHSPNGLARQPADVRALTSFLSEHYTTRSETAGALAAYVASLASTGHNRGPGAAAPTGRDHRRTTSAPANAEQKVKKEKRRVRDDGDVPRPPRPIRNFKPDASSKPDDTAPPDAQAPASQPHEADDPAARLRTSLSSGMNSQNATTEAGKTGAPKARKHRKAADDAPAGAKATADGPVAEPAAAPPATTTPAEAPVETTPGDP